MIEIAIEIAWMAMRGCYQFFFEDELARAVVTSTFTDAGNLETGRTVDQAEIVGEYLAYIGLL